MANKFLSDLDGPYQTQAPDDWSWLDYIKAGASDTGNALSNLAGGIIGGMSPFHPNAARAGQPSYQVPPMLLDAWEAINAPGKILNEGMTVEDRDRTATNAAGFMMGGGLVAPKPSAVRPNARLSSLPADELASLETGWPVAATYGKRDQFGQIREFESYLPPTDIMMRDMRNAGDIDFDYMMRRADNESAPLRGASDIDYLNALGRQINDRDGDLFSNGSKSGAGVGAGITRGAEAETSAAAGRLANSLSPNQPQAPQTANGLPGQTPALYQGQEAQAPRSLIENDPHLKAWADHLGLDYDGLLSPSIADAAANDAYQYYGLRATPYKMEVGQTPKNSTQWYQDFINEQQSRNMFPDHGEDLGGASSVGVEMTPEGIKKARRLIANYWGPDGSYGDFVHILGANRAWGGNDVGELVMRDSTVIGNAPRRSYGETLFSNGSKPGAAIGAGVVEGAKPIRAYHGTDGPMTGKSFDGPSFWANENPSVASKYAEGLHRGSSFEATAPNVLPVDMIGSVYDATGLPNTTGLFDVARQNAREAGADIIKYLGGNYEAINRGSVKSPLTNETLFSNGSPVGAPIGSSMQQDQITTEDLLRLLGIQ